MLRLTTLLILALIAFPAAGLGSDILVVHSDSKGGAWADLAASGMQKAFSQDMPEAHITRYYTESDRDDSEDHFDDVVDDLEALMGKNDFSGVIFDRDIALALLRRYRNTLFSDIPASFCGVVQFSPEIQAQCGCTGVVSSPSAAKTLETMLSLHPSTRTVIVFTDESFMGDAIRKQVMKYFAAHMDRFQLMLPGYEPGRPGVPNAEQARKLVGHLPKNTLVLFGALSEDGTGSPVDQDRLVRDMIAESPAPVYVCSSQYFGFGAAGGLLTTPEKQGELAAEMLMNRLRGNPAAKTVTAENKWLLDAQGMQKAEFDRDALPREAFVANLEPAPGLNALQWILLLGALAVFGIVFAFKRKK